MNKPVFAEAHGRVNLIGEHTDYNGGWVLPTAIPQKTTVQITRRDDMFVRATSGEAGPDFEALKYMLGDEVSNGRWIDYLQGATKLLREDGFKLGGFDVHVESAVPVGSGLSSSAALEIAFLKALRETFSLEINDVEIARLGQRIENDFVGARVGIMDQMACALAREGEALFLDTVDLSYENVRLPLEKADLVVINSGVAHRNSGGGYNRRRAECEDACRLLGVSLLREIGSSDLAKVEALPEPLRRRVRHVVTENRRVHDAVRAIRAEDVSALGDLFLASHASMRDDYEVSVPEIDLLVELCMATEDVYGARLTGGGFGGSIVAMAHKGTGRAMADAVVAQYGARTGLTAAVMVPGASA